MREPFKLLCVSLAKNFLDANHSCLKHPLIEFMNTA